jgi:hypothetical protein
MRHFPRHFQKLIARHGFSLAISLRHFPIHFPGHHHAIFYATMNDANKTRRLAHDYLAAVDRAIALVQRAKKLRDALRRAAKKRNHRENATRR